MKINKFILAILFMGLINSGIAHASDAQTDPPGDGVVKPLQTLKAERLKTDLDRRDLITLVPQGNLGFRSLAEVLIGRVPGVQVTGNFYDYRIRVRGSRRPPLIVLDDFPFYGYDDAMVNDLLQSIPVLDVASIQVIRNIASASLYGPGAGNGVILINTKTGDEGEME